MTEKPSLDPNFGKNFDEFLNFKSTILVEAQIQSLLGLLDPNDFELPSGNSDPEVQALEFRQFLESRIAQNHEISGCDHDLSIIHLQNWAGASETTKFFNRFRKYHRFEGEEKIMYILVIFTNP